MNPIVSISETDAEAALIAADFGSCLTKSNTNRLNTSKKAADVINVLGRNPITVKVAARFTNNPNRDTIGVVTKFVGKLIRKDLIAWKGITKRNFARVRGAKADHINMVMIIAGKDREVRQ